MGPVLLVEANTIPFSDFTVESKTMYAGSLTSGITLSSTAWTQGTDSFIGYNEFTTQSEATIYQLPGLSSGQTQTLSSTWSAGSLTTRSDVLSGFSKRYFTAIETYTDKYPMHVKIQWCVTTSASGTSGRIYVCRQSSATSMNTLPVMEFDIVGKTIYNISGDIPYRASTSYYLKFDVIEVTPTPLYYAVTVTNNSNTQYSNVGLVSVENGQYTTQLSGERHQIQVGESQTFTISPPSVTIGAEFQPVEFDGETHTEISHTPSTLTFASTYDEYVFEITVPSQTTTQSVTIDNSNGSPRNYMQIWDQTSDEAVSSVFHIDNNETLTDTYTATTGHTVIINYGSSSTSLTRTMTIQQSWGAGPYSIVLTYGALEPT